jgi:hypothetical protein
MLDHKISVLDAYFAFAFRKTRIGLIVRIAKTFLEGGRPGWQSGLPSLLSAAS